MTGPPTAVAEIRAAVRRDLADLPSSALVLVACSGGADSLALAAATAFVAPRLGLLAGAVVVDHGLQHWSDDVARGAAASLTALDLRPVEVRRVEVGTDGGPEAAARAARYGALRQAAEQLGAQAVLLGHTLDDQAETVLLGLVRGSGARSLAGMAPRTGLLRRPLLGLRRETTQAACAAAGLRPWVDPHNADSRFARVRARVNVLPTIEEQLGPGIAQALTRTAALLRADADALDGWAEVELTACRATASDVAAAVSKATSSGKAAQDSSAEASASPGAEPGPGESIELDVVRLSALPTAVRTRVLRLAAIEAGAQQPSATQVAAMDALVTDWHGQGSVALSGGRSVRRCCGRLLLGDGTRSRGHGRGGGSEWITPTWARTSKKS